MMNMLINVIPTYILNFLLAVMDEMYYVFGNLNFLSIIAMPIGNAISIK